MQVLVRNRLETSLFAGVKEAGWTPEDQRKRDSFVLLVGNARLPNSPESRLKFMEQARFPHADGLAINSSGWLLQPPVQTQFDIHPFLALALTPWVWRPRDLSMQLDRALALTLTSPDPSLQPKFDANLSLGRCWST